VLTKDLDAIKDISGTMVTYSKSLAGDSVPPEQADKFFESLLSRSRAMTSTRADLEEDILQLSRHIDMISSAEKKKHGKTDGEVSVVIMAKKATNIELRLTYRMWSSIPNVDILPDCSLVVRNATWSAAYELHATTEAGVPAPSVSLHYRARITQSTGEDWTDVKLTLSTADMDLSNKTIPVLIPTKIGFPSRKVVHEQQFMSFTRPGIESIDQAVECAKARRRFSGIRPSATRGSPHVAFGPPPGAFLQPELYVPPSPELVAPGSSSGSGASTPLAGPPRCAGPPPQIGFMSAQRQYIEFDRDEELTTAIGEPVSVVRKSPLALTYQVEGASGVPSDNVPHQVSIAVLPFEATTQHVTIPKVQPVAYLQATVKNTSDYRLIPGTVHAFVDDSFVSKTSIVGDVAPGDEFSCTLGTDPATRVYYECTTKSADDADANTTHGGSASSEKWSASTTFRSCTTVTNRHPFALRELVVRDNVPVSEDEKRTCVVLRYPAGLAELEQKGELRVGADDSEREGKDEKQKTQTQTRMVRWGKVVDGKGGKKEGLFEWVVEVEAGEEITIEAEWDIKVPVSLGWFKRVRNKVRNWLRW
jgi:hypothetical protein